MTLGECSGLKGLRLLVVEDEVFTALLIEDLVTSLGCVLAGTASTVNEALKLIEMVPIDGALIDVNLGGEMAAPVIQALSDRGIPLILVTGYEAPPPNGFPVVHKPFEPHDLRDAINQHLGPNGRTDHPGNSGHSLPRRGL